MAMTAGYDRGMVIRMSDYEGKGMVMKYESNDSR